MAESLSLAAEKRATHGTRNAKRLRRQGWLPAVIYGHQQAVFSVQVKNDDVRSIIRHGVRVVDLQIDGATEKCLIKEVQWDTFGREVVHVDFARVSADERIRVVVPIQVRGTAPGVTAGGILNQPMHVMEIECPALEVPDSIRVSLIELQIEQAIHLRDVHLPAGVKALGDPDAIVVQVVKPAEEAGAVAAAPAEGPVEPEVIGRKVEKAEEETE
jgi:large subunit ribosomal protein L25